MIKSALSVAFLLVTSAYSFGGLSMTFTVGNSTFTVYDDDENDAIPGLGQIAVGQVDLADGIVYRFIGAYAQAVYSPNGGWDGAKYSVISNVNSIANRGTTSPPQTAAQAADDNDGKVVSVYTHYSGFSSIIDSPTRAQANVIFSMQGLSQDNPANTSNVQYGAYYDPTNPDSTVPVGTSIFSGTDSLYGGVAPGNNPTAEFTGYSFSPNFSSNTFSMGVYYAVTPTSTSGANINQFAFAGTSFLEQVPEPSHTALPVGIAVGIVALRRRRVIRR